jgi:RNA polymerase sigma factor (sigma-70 family)
LLAEFAVHRDESAFAELVSRHGKLVLGVAYRHLPDRQAAEDVFQATFVALSRNASRLGRPPSLVNWLYTVALRLARKTRLRFARRTALLSRVPIPSGPADPLAEVSGRELVTIIDDELSRLPAMYRLPLLLCAIEGMSRVEAARRLGWPVGSVKGRLERGRELLRKRLAKRGLAAPAVLAGGLLATTSEAMPARLVTPVTRAAVAAAAAAGLGRPLMMLLTVAAISVIGVGSAVWPGPQRLGVGTLPPAVGPPPLGPAQGDVTFAGRVLGPDGKPLPGAHAFFSGLTPAIEFVDRTISRSDGTFRFTVRRNEINEGAFPLSRLPPESGFRVGASADGCGSAGVWPTDPSEWERLTLWLPAEEIVRGRIVYEDGKPVPGVRVAAFLSGARMGKDQKPRPYDAPPEVGERTIFVPNDPARNEGITDADGRVTLRCLSRDWLYELRISGPTVVSANVQLVARPDPPRFLVYGSTFTHETKRCKPITGIVRERASGRPLAGITLMRGLTANSMDVRMSTTTDNDGRYTLTGLPRGSHRLLARPPANAPYVATEVIVPDHRTGYDPVVLDVELERQPIVTGRLVDQSTGKPVRRGRVEYRPLAGNPNLAANSALAVPSLDNDQPRTWTEADGRFTLPVLSGRGVILVRAESDFLAAKLTRADIDAGILDTDDVELIDCRPFAAWPAEFHAYRLVNLPLEGTVDLTIDLVPGRSRELVVTYPDGRASSASVLGLHPTACASWGEAYRAGRSVVGGMAAGERRRLYISTRDGKYAAAEVVRAKEPGPAVVRLKPTGTVTGRLIGEDGKPVADARFRLFFDDAPGRAGIFVDQGTLLRDMPPDDLRRAQRARPYAEAVASTLSRSEHSGADGRFTLSGLMPDIPFSLQVILIKTDTADRRLVTGEVTVARPTVKAGQTLDLGDLRTFPPAIRNPFDSIR